MPPAEPPREGHDALDEGKFVVPSRPPDDQHVHIDEMEAGMLLLEGERDHDDDHNAPKRSLFDDLATAGPEQPTPAPTAAAAATPSPSPSPSPLSNLEDALHSSVNDVFSKAQASLEAATGLPLRLGASSLASLIEVDRQARLSAAIPGSDMTAVFLGTGSMYPTKHRGTSSVALRWESDGGDIWLFDAGEGTQLQIQASPIRAGRIRRVFVSHMHGDHMMGLAGIVTFLTSHATREVPLEIYGPEGLRNHLRAALWLSNVKKCGYWRVHELKGVPYLHDRWYRPPRPVKAYNFPREIDGGDDIYPHTNGTYTLFHLPHVTVSAAPLRHTVPTVGYVIEEKSRPGRVDTDVIFPIIERNAEELRQMYPGKNPKKIIQRLKSLGAGEAYRFPDGTVVSAEEVVPRSREGRKVAICQDSCDSSAIAELAKDADLLVHECTNSLVAKDAAAAPGTDPDDPPLSADDIDTALPINEWEAADWAGLRQQLDRQTFDRGHSTPTMAARFARSIEARRLVLTHFSQRYKGDSSIASVQTMMQLEREASQVLSEWDHTDERRAWAADRVSGNGDPGPRVIAAWDGMELSIPRRE